MPNLTERVSNIKRRKKEENIAARIEYSEAEKTRKAAMNREKKASKKLLKRCGAVGLFSEINKSFLHNRGKINIVTKEFGVERDVGEYGYNTEWEYFAGTIVELKWKPSYFKKQFRAIQVQTTPNSVDILSTYNNENPPNKKNLEWEEPDRLGPTDFRRHASFSRNNENLKEEFEEALATLCSNWF